MKSMQPTFSLNLLLGHREDAECAIAAMDGRREEYLVLSVEWVHRPDAAPQHQNQQQQQVEQQQEQTYQGEGEQNVQLGEGEQRGAAQPQWVVQVAAKVAPVDAQLDASTPIPAAQMRFPVAKGQQRSGAAAHATQQQEQRGFAAKAGRQQGWGDMASGRTQRWQRRVGASRGTCGQAPAAPTLEQMRELKAKALTRLGLAAPGQALREDHRHRGGQAAVAGQGRRMAASSYAGSSHGDGASVSALSMC